MRLTVRLISRGMADVLKFRGLEQELQRRADRVLSQAQSNSPVDSGDYRASLHAYTHEHRTRVVAHVEAAVPYAVRLEASRRTLGMSIDAARG